MTTRSRRTRPAPTICTPRRHTAAGVAERRTATWIGRYSFTLGGLRRRRAGLLRLPNEVEPISCPSTGRSRARRRLRHRGLLRRVRRGAYSLTLFINNAFDERADLSVSGCTVLALGAAGISPIHRLPAGTAAFPTTHRQLRARTTPEHQPAEDVRTGLSGRVRPRPGQHEGQARRRGLALFRSSDVRMTAALKRRVTRHDDSANRTDRPLRPRPAAGGSPHAPRHRGTSTRASSNSSCRRRSRTHGKYACRLDQVREPGQYVTLELAGEPILIVRGNDDVLRGFFNVCRHHAAAVMTEPAGCVKRLACPYHGWTYALEGTLKGTPDFETCAISTAAANGLVPSRRAPGRTGCS